MLDKFTLPPGAVLLEQDYCDRNYYDCSQFETGDTVISYLDPGKVGRLEKISRYIWGEDINYLWVYWDDGTADCYYPAQLLKIEATQNNNENSAN